MIPRRFITVAECREYLALKSNMTVYSLIYRKEIPSVRIGRTIRVDLKKLEEQLEKAEKP